MVAVQALAEHDVEAARAELADGRPVTVWFTPAAVGVPAGGSAKIVALGDAADGDFIQVRPTGSRDSMYCSPGELTRIRPPRRPRGPEPDTRASGSRTAAVARPAAAPDPTPQPAAAPGAARASSRGSRAGTASAEVTVTLSATAEGEWAVEVTVGRKRTVRPTPVPPGAVAAAARALPSPVSEAISSALDAARRRRAEQVERLRAELDAAQRALEELDG
jgi:hypothetical protein